MIDGGISVVPKPNRLLRAARERTPSRRVPGAYMSREEVAEAVALWAAEHDDKHRSVAFDANHLGKLERGTVRCPQQRYVTALCAVLGTTPAELGFDAVATATRPLRALPDPSSSSGSSEQGAREVPTDASDRKRLIFASHAGITCELLRLLSMLSVLMTIPSADEQPDQSDYSSIITPDQFDNVAVDDYTALNEHLWRVFALSKSKGAVLPLVCDQLDVLIHTWPQPIGRNVDIHRRLCMLASELLQLAGEIFFDANKYSDAAYCYTLSAAASKEADAFDLWACAMTRHAFIEIYERRFDKAAPMLELAARLARRGDGTLSTRYWVSSVQAQAFAGLGDLVACQRALDTAEQVCELSGDASNGGWLRFDGSRLAEERGACYVQLRRPDLAEIALGEALRQGLSARRRASVLTDLAMIGLQRGDVDQLISYTEATLEIATHTGSGFISRKLQELQSHLAPLLENSRVRQLDQQIIVISRNFEPR